MKIAMFLDSAFPPDSRVENEAVSLINAGHEVHLFSIDYGGVRLSYEIYNGIHVHRFRANKLTFKLSALAYTFPGFHSRIKPGIKQFINEVKPDVLHIHDMVIAKAVLDVNKNSITVLDLHENRPEIMKHYKHINEGMGRWLISPDKWAIEEEKLIKRADKLILVTKEARKVVADKKVKDTADIIVVPNTILPEVYLQYDLDHQIIDKFKSTFNIVYLGDTSLRRGTDTAIRALSILLKRVPNARLILVGNSSIDEKLKALAKSLDIYENIAFEGWQDVSLFPSYTLASDVCISPLKRNLHHDTTFANKLFQYMAMGKPVVVSDSTTQANVVTSEKCGLVHEAGNELDLADKLFQIYADKNLADEFGENGKKAVEERWNWDITSKDLIEMYSKLEYNSTN